MLERTPKYLLQMLLPTTVGMLLSIVGVAQCPDNLFTVTEEQMEQLKTTYPNCTTILGDVIIDGFDTHRLKDLTAFQKIKSINGSLFIGNHLSLNDLNGWNQLEHLGGDLIIINNPGLEVLNGFKKLKEVGGTLKIVNCQQLTALDFPTLETVGQHLTIFYNPLLRSLTGFTALREVGRDLKIIKNELIEDCNGFENLETIGNGLIIYHNPALLSLNGLENLQSIQDRILLIANDSLRDCTSGFCYRFLPDQQLIEGYIRENACGCRNATEVRITCLGDTVDCTPTYTIAGSIQTPINLPIKEVTVRLSGTIIDSIQTDEQGTYRFEDLPMGEYYIQAFRNEDYTNGVSLIDASLINSHATGTPPLLDSPYQLLAADIDQSQAITLEDGNWVKLLAQGSIEEWETVPAWGFIRADVALEAMPNDPWLTLQNENEDYTIIHIPELRKDHLATHFIGYKYGDVNNSVSP